MEKGKEWILQLVAGLGWACFGVVTVETAALPFWIGWIALVAGGGLAATALDKAFQPKRW